ncbi:MAG TPA: hypothetical protein DCY12_08850 [Candidatus Atribacteria bacterium]|nr:hypothetical protein [Candidatus Atribacteria bacterium]
MTTKNGLFWNKSWNPVKAKGGGFFCTKISPGCQNCWSEALNLRFGNGLPFDNRQVEFELDQRILEAPFHWRKPRIVAVQWLGDLFHEQIPYKFKKQIIEVIDWSTKHTFLILTKRPQRMLEWFSYKEHFRVRADRVSEECGDTFHLNHESSDPTENWPLDNLWLGVSISTQQEANEKIPILLQTPATHRFVNLEPMLEEINFSYITNPKISPTHNVLGNKYGVYQYSNEIINWVLLGCESGPGRRPMKLEWARNIVEQCKASGVPLFIKQLDLDGKVEKDLSKFPNDLKIREHPIWK